MSGGAGEPAVVEPPVGDAWDRARWMWSAAMLVLLGLSALFASLDGDVSVGRRALAVAGTLVMGLFFAFVVDRIPEEHPGQLVAVVALIPMWMALALVHPVFHLVLFALFPQIYIRLTLAQAYAASAALGAATVAVEVIDGSGSPAAWVTYAAVFTLILGIAAFQGRWIHGIIAQSAERRDLIEQLEATRSELATAERTAGRFEERQRLAAEIHDTLAQGFTSIVMLLEAVAADLPVEVGSDTRRRLALASSTARQNLEEARRLVADLDPAPLDGATLVSAIRRLTATFSEETGVRSHLTVDGDPVAVPPATDVAVLRAAQEALANVGKHASATTVTITLAFDGPGVVLEVADDGIGFDPEAAAGHGLRGIRRRVEPMGGTVSIETAVGSGTHVRVEVP